MNIRKAWLSTRGCRNNNPFNLRRSFSRWLGKIPFNKSTDKDFEQFDTLEHGLRAGIKNILQYPSRYNACTIRSIISIYAPKSENCTDNYIVFVSDYVGFDSDALLVSDDGSLDLLLWCRLCGAITYFECAYDLTYEEFCHIVDFYHFDKFFA